MSHNSDYATRRGQISIISMGILVNYHSEFASHNTMNKRRGGRRRSRSGQRTTLPAKKIARNFEMYLEG